MKIFAGKAFVQVQAFLFFRTSFQKVEFAQFHNLGWVTVMWKRASFWTFWTFSEHKLFANSEFFFIIFLAISVTSWTMFSPFLTSATFIFGTWSFSEKIRIKNSLVLILMKHFGQFWIFGQKVACAEISRKNKVEVSQRYTTILMALRELIT